MCPSPGRALRQAPPLLCWLCAPGQGPDLHCRQEELKHCFLTVDGFRGSVYVVAKCFAPLDAETTGPSNGQHFTEGQEQGKAPLRACSARCFCDIYNKIELADEPY